jgi:cytochrome c oxidase subunit 2
MQDFQLFPRSASSLSDEVDALHGLLVAISAVTALGICCAVLWFCVHYRRRPGNERGAAIDGDLRLEILWTAIPLVICLGFFGWGATLYAKQRQAPVDGMDFHVTAKQWMWKLQHPTGQREINALHVPRGTNVRLTMTSQDVIHSFFVPAFRLKFDVLPGRFTTAWFQATRSGRYHLFCVEYSGTKHSEMIGEVVVMEPTDYEHWLSGMPAEADPITAGRALYEGLRCDTCHHAGADRRGPDLAGLFGSTALLTDGAEVVVDEDYLRESIVEPNSKRTKGYEPIMPTYAGQLSEDELLALIAYLKSIGATEEKP